MRDLERARFAFSHANSVPPAARKAYRSRVQGLGADILRGGLAAAVTFLEREKGEDAAQLLLQHLAAAEVTGLASSGTPFAAGVRALGADDYILATRETLRLCLWLRRAVQAWPDEPERAS